MRMTERKLCYLGLGSSIGDRLSYLRFALVRMGAWPGAKIVAVSGVYETSPVGGVAENLFFNAAVGLETEIPPHELLDLIHAIEQEAGRERPTRWDDRTLDVDILYMGDLVLMADDLQIPHPRIATRRFVLAPLAEIAPDFRDPITGVSIVDKLAACPDTAAVTLMPDMKLSLSLIHI